MRRDPSPSERVPTPHREGNMRNTSRLAPLSLVLAACVAPSQEADPAAATPEEHVADTSSAIVGEFARRDDDNPSANTVVKIEGNIGNCTGTLITPTAVLTAWHCIGA